MHRITAAERPNPDPAGRISLECSFCGRDADHVRFLCAGEFGGTICDRCAAAASTILLKARLRSVLRRFAA